MIPLIENVLKRHKILLGVIILCIFGYTIIHFFYGGVYCPFKYAPHIPQIEEEIVPLVKFLNGDKFIINNERQYGSFFILVMTPFMILYKSPIVFENALLLLQYVLVFLSFYICYKHIFPYAAFKSNAERRIVFWSLLILWLNFVPLLCTIVAKNVEVWELFLICLGYLMYKQRRYFLAGYSFAAATLIKLLPAIFIFYSFFKERKVFFYSLLWMFIIMISAHIIFGPSIGLMYLPFLLSRPFGSRTFAAAHFENNSIKGFIYKCASGFKSDSSYFFPCSPENEKIAFIITTMVQLLMLSYLIIMSLKKNCSKDDTLLQFSIISVFMMLIAPIATFESNALLLFAYSAGLYFMLYKKLPAYLYVLFMLSYFLVGNFFPLTTVVKLFPFGMVNTYLGNERFTMDESYKAYCVPFFGVILLAVFFVTLWHKRNILKAPNL